MPARRQREQFQAARLVVERAIAARLCSGATVEFGCSAEPIWQEAFGKVGFGQDSRATALDTPFDLASLTKPLATTTIVMRLVDRGRVRLDDPVSAFFDEWRGPDRESVTVADLLEHASGLAARLVDPAPRTRREFEHEICTMRLEYPPRTGSLYSDLGFLLLGFLVADRGGLPLEWQFSSIMHELRIDRLTFELPPDEKRGAAETRPLDDDQRRGRVFTGTVHDSYAAALGGVAGHAGLFGSASAVGSIACAYLRAARGDRTLPSPLSPELVSRMTTRSSVPGSSRALGWDTMLTSSSCGEHMSASAFGHVGFTGTSVWIDPVRDRYFVLLTNRAAGAGTLDDMRETRRAFHDALAF